MTNNISEVSFSPGQGFNLGYPEFEAEVGSLSIRRKMKIFFGLPPRNRRHIAFFAFPINR
jgi:hypothetical protein